MYYSHGQRAPVPLLADNFAAQSEDDLPYMWRGSPEHPEIMEERAQMDMLTDERGRLMRTVSLTLHPAPLFLLTSRHNLLRSYRVCVCRRAHFRSRPATSCSTTTP